MAIASMQLDPDGEANPDDLADLDAAASAKLAGIEDSATADQTGAEIKTAYEGEANAYTDTKDTKLGSIEEAATADQSESDIKTLFSWTTSPEDGATGDQTGDEMVAAIDSGSASITREDALSQDDLKLVKTNPVAGEFQVKNVHVQADGKLDVEYDDVAES